ncbi:hypothetical protein HQN90_11095 [Paenibacillus alba]|uniref:hypothetical protein n=1 Tax=Paenibacillus alba TaxID=1197127 RepID=UPI001563EA26|nr:hypothetical protein [Paenibacillus alba]NQX66673.1 hypothetical protein [Paenibacillus alba]
MDINDLFNELEILRTPFEMKDYFDRIIFLINEQPELLEQARLNKGKYKQFIEEFYPLYCFSQSKYCKHNSRLKIIIGNQPYDAIMHLEDGTEEKFELTNYIDGEWEFFNAKELNKSGIGKIRFNDTRNLVAREQEYLQKIMKNVEKKSKKDYSHANIIFVVNTSDYFEVYGRSSRSFVRRLKDELMNVKLNAKTIFLLVLNNQSIDSINENLLLIKENAQFD